MILWLRSPSGRFMLPVLLAVAAAVGVGAVVVKIITDEAEETERRRKKVADLRRQVVRSIAEEDRAAARAKAEQKEWRLARDHLRNLIEAAIEERKSIYKGLSKLKAARGKLLDALKTFRNPEAEQRHIGLDRRAIREAINDYDDVVNRKYAEAYRFTAFIDEAYRYKDDLYGRSNPRAQIKAARRFNRESAFDLADIPIKGKVVVGIVRAPKRGPWFQLDCSIRGRLVDRESDMYHKKWSKGERVRLFVESANYSEGIATVSVGKAEFLDAWHAGQIHWTGRIEGENAHGIEVALADSGVTAFVPRSMVAGNWTNGAHRANVKLVEVDRRLRRVIARLVSTSNGESSRATGIS